MLPKSRHPTFTETLPSNNEKITMRPFTVKEEKILLYAEQDDTSSTLDTIRQILSNCVLNDNFDVDKLPIFDIEFLFLKLRSKSVNNIIELTITDGDEAIPIIVDLNKITVEKKEGHSTKIILSPHHGMVMSYPSIAFMKELENAAIANPVDRLFYIMVGCVAQIWDGDDVYERGKDFTHDELLVYFDDLSKDDFVKVSEFFDAMPAVVYKTKYKTKAGAEKPFELRGLTSFFQ